jgi:hypothetical protein
MPLPESGLSSGSVASLYTAGNNASNQVAQNQFLIDQQNADARAKQINQLLGFGLQAYKDYKGGGKGSQPS